MILATAFFFDTITIIIIINVHAYIFDTKKKIYSLLGIMTEGKSTSPWSTHLQPSTLERIREVIRKQQESSDFPAFCIAHVTDPNYRFLFLDHTCIRSTTTPIQDAEELVAQREYYESSLRRPISSALPTPHSSSSSTLRIGHEKEKEQVQRQTASSLSVTSSTRHDPFSTFFPPTTIPPSPALLLVLFRPTYAWNPLQTSPYACGAARHPRDGSTPLSSSPPSSTLTKAVRKRDKVFIKECLESPIISLEHVDDIWEQLYATYAYTSSSSSSFPCKHHCHQCRRHRHSQQDNNPQLLSNLLSKKGVVVGPHPPHLFKRYEGLLYFIEDTLVAVEEESEERVHGVIQFMLSRLPMTECFVFVLSQLCKQILCRIERLFLLLHRHRHLQKNAKPKAGATTQKEKDGKEKKIKVEGGNDHGARCAAKTSSCVFPLCPPPPCTDDSDDDVENQEGAAVVEVDSTLTLFGKRKRTDIGEGTSLTARVKAEIVAANTANRGTRSPRSRSSSSSSNEEEEEEEDEEYSVESDSEDSRPTSPSATLPSAEPSLLLSSPHTHHHPPFLFADSLLAIIMRSTDYVGAIFYMIVHLFSLHRQRDGVFLDVQKKGAFLEEVCEMEKRRSKNFNTRPGDTASVVAIYTGNDTAENKSGNSNASNNNNKAKNTKKWTGDAYYGDVFERYFLLVSRWMIQPLRCCVPASSPLSDASQRNTSLSTTSSTTGLAAYKILVTSSPYKYLVTMMKTWVTEECWSEEALTEWNSFIHEIS